MLGDFHSNFGNLRIAAEEMVDQKLGEFLNAGDIVLSGKHVDGVLDRVGGQNLAVVAGFIRGVEITPKKNSRRDVLETVLLSAAIELHQPDARFAVRVGN